MTKRGPREDQTGSKKPGRREGDRGGCLEKSLGSVPGPGEASGQDRGGRGPLRREAKFEEREAADSAGSIAGEPSGLKTEAGVPCVKSPRTVGGGVQ